MAPRSEDPKLIIRVTNLELVQPICSAYVNVTDRQTDGRTTYDRNTALALRASRGKNEVSGLFVPKIMKIYVNLLKLRIVNRRLFFPGHGVV